MNEICKHKTIMLAQLVDFDVARGLFENVVTKLHEDLRHTVVICKQN